MALALLLVVGWTGLVEACPNCKDALTGDPARANLARGYYFSILFMVSMPFVIFGLLASYFYFEVRRARALHSRSAVRTAPTGAEILSAVQ